MKNIAVIGFTNLKEFRDWGLEQVTGHKNKVGKNYIVDNDSDTLYLCVTCLSDINGMHFDSIVDVDPLRNYVKQHLYPAVYEQSERDEFAESIAKLLAKYANCADQPCKLSATDDDLILYFTHNYSIGKYLWDNGLRFIKETQNGKD